MGFSFNPFTGKLDLVGGSGVSPSEVEYNATIANNQVAAADVTGMLIDGSIHRSCVVTYQIYRNTASVERSGTGHLILNYKSVAGTWQIDQSGLDELGVLFSITNLGQVQYTSDNMAGAGYVGKIVFKMQKISVES